MNKILSLGSRGLFLLVTALLMVSLLGSVTNAYASVTLNWTAPTTNTDGTLLTDLAGCNIYYGTSSGNYTAEINVGNVTTYTFTNLAAGTYYFAVAAYDTSGNQSVYSNEVVQTVGASISGTVTSTTGMGIANVYVEVDNSSGNYIASGWTASDGTYTVSGIPTGSYTINFSTYGSNYLRQWYNNETSSDSANLVSVTAPNTTSGVNAVLAVGGSISGIVTNAAGMGISNVYVEMDDGSGNYAAEGVTASDGTYTFSGIPTGSYTVNFSPDGSNYLVQWYNDESSSDSADVVSVNAPNATSGVNAVLAVGGSISGIVTNAAGMGISSVTVEIDDDSGNYIASAVTASDGTYTVSWIPSGSYTVNFIPADGANYLLQWYNNETSLGSANLVSVNAPNTTSGVNAVLAVGGSISGIVTNAAEMGISSVYVEVDDGSGNYIASGWSALDGTYTVTGIPTGSYTVNFSPYGSNYLVQWYNNESNSGSANMVSVTVPNTTSGINAVLPVGGSISGIVTNAAGLGIADVYVEVDDGSDNYVAAAWTASDGTYTAIGIPTGSYTVNFSPNSPLYSVQWYNNESSYGSANIVSVTAPNTISGISAVLPIGQYTLPTVTTTGISNVTSTTATGGGNVTSNGGSPITAQGVCWSSTSITPTTSSGPCTSDGTVTPFTSSITGLAPNTTYYVRAYATNVVGTVYGSYATFTTSPLAALPTVTMTGITNVTSTTATGGGNVTSNGGSAITAEGVCWSSTSTTPTTSSGPCTSDGTVTPFTSSITGLAPNTTYYVRAYATNVAGTAYGSYVTFTTLAALPTVTTTSISNVTSTTATGGGNVTSNGGSAITAEGVCWSSTSTTPTTSSGPCTSDGTVTPFTSSITGLAPNTTYYVRAYATNVAGTAYDSYVTFTTLALPIVTTTGITNVTSTTATGGGNVTSNGGSAITAEGVCWSSTSTTPTTSSGPCTSDGTVTPFTSSITGLAPNTTYYVRAYATNVAGTAYGSDVTFTTLAATPTVTMTGISNVTSTTATGGGNVTSNGGSPITAEGVCWSSTSTTPATSSGPCTSDGTVTPFTSSITGLAPNTTYYVRAYAINVAGTAYGSDVTFTTLAALPTVTTTGISNMTSTTATGGGNVTSNGGSPITAEGVCWSSTSTTPTTSSGPCTSDGTVTPFTSFITGLAPNTTYYVRAYATNVAGTAYGSDVTFTTLAALPTVTTTSISNMTSTTATGGGNVTSNGGSPITAEGVCWSSTSTTPTTSSGSCTSDGTVTPFTSSITGLAPNTTYYVRAYATNVAGTAYGSYATFTTLVASPTVTTTGISNVTSTTATGGGNVTSNGGSPITAEGVCWSSTSTTPTTSSGPCTSDGTVTPFTSSITGLAFNTTYYVRAYATNVAGTAYGSDVTFTTLAALPTVTTTGISNVASTTATGGGNVTSNGGSPITAEGVCWSSTSTTPTTSSGPCTSDGTVTPFTSSITGLSPNTTYYVRAYATNVAGTAYGSDVTFTTLVASPTVTTTGITNVTSTTATGGGNVTSNGGSPITAEGVCWSSTSTTPTTSSGPCTSDGTVTPFTSSITGLSPNTTYYVRAYATNVVGTAYGSDVTFTTLPALPTVTTTGITNVTSTTATGGGNVTSNGGSAITAEGVCWSSTSTTPTTSSGPCTSDGTVTPFTSSITGLVFNTTYYVRAYATNTAGTAYGSDVTFTTLAEPTVTTTAITGITSTTATGGGNVTSNGGHSITAEGVCWSSTSTSPTTSSSPCTSNGTVTGSFSSSITGLVSNTTYYVRAYATNRIGTAYGNYVTFTTLALPTVTTTVISSITSTTATGGGNVTSNGGAALTAEGVCYGLTANPALGGTCTSDGTVSGAYVSSLTGLAPGQLYHVRAYATNSVGTSYGTDLTFTTLAAPTVTTTTITVIASTTATGGGNVTSNGGTALTAEGVCYGLTANPALGGTCTSDGTVSGAYVSSLTGLTPGQLYHVRAYATNSVGTSYGTDLTFTTLALPTVTTTTITVITSTTATGGGTVTSNGGTTLTAEGVCYGLTANPALGGTCTSDGTVSGAYVSSLTGLTPGQLYHVRAYATNSVGTSYGTDLTFTTLALPTVTTTTITVITSTTATGGGTVTSNGGTTLTAEGVCYGLTANPALGGTCTSDGTVSGAYVSSLTGLAPGQLYHVRAYATNSVGTSYGTDTTFTTLALPTVTTTTITVITSTTATGGGTVTSNGGTTLTAEGVCYGLTANPALGGTCTSDGTVSGAYVSSLTGLAPGQLYHVRAYATNSVGTSYGTDLTFTTLAAPTVTTTTITGITSTTATGGGTVTSNGGTTLTAEGVCYGLTLNPALGGTCTSDGTVSGAYVSSLTGLAPGQLYHVRAYATNSVGTSYGTDLTFTTLAAPTVTTTTITGITSTTATGGGNVTSTGGATLTAEGVCYGLTLNPALGGTCTSDGTVSGAYVSSLTGLTPGQLYHVRAYATNSVGTAYGTDTTFTTLALPTVTTTTITNITSTTATGGGTVTSNGGTTLTAEGVCYGLTLNPALGGTCTSDGTVAGAYVSSLTGMTPGQLYHVRAYATNSVGTAYGTDTTFTTLALPTVTTTVISSITSTTATGGGTVTSNGGTTLTAEGVCYGLTLNPALGGTCTSDGTVSGAYVSSLTGLTSGQLYHVRAYATNSVGTAYGTDTTFTTLAAPTVTTTTITGITSTTATGGGNVTSNGGTTLTAEGVCYGLTANPALGGTCTSDGTVSGAYVSSLTGLTPGQLYHVRAYATNSVGTSYGTDTTFTTLAAPTVTTTTITGITSTTATGGGNVTSNGGTTLTAEGVCYGLTLNPALGGTCTSDGTVSGAYVSSLTGLTPGQLYHVRAYATNSVGTSYGTDLTFTTLAAPTVSTTTITNIASTTATGGGTVTSTGGTTLTAEGVCYGLTLNPALGGTCTSDGTVSGAYVSSLTGLTPGQLYHVRAYATNSVGTSYGTDTTFTTLAAPTVTTTTITGITSTTATGGGNVTSNGGTTLTAEGVCYGLTLNPALGGTCTSDGTVSGAYVSSLTGLTPGQLYHVRAYATNSVGTSYGTDLTFTTLAAPTVSTTTITNIASTTATGGGTVTSTGGTTLTAEGVCYGLTLNPALGGTCTSDGTVSGAYVSSLTGLTPGQLYHVRAYATNSVGTSYGTDTTFTTLALPTVTTTTITGITSTTAAGGGTVTSNGGTTLTAEGVCFGLTLNPALGGTCTSDGTVAGAYVSSLTGLTPGQLYHVRAYATNSVGTSYGTDTTFTTLALPTVTTTTITGITSTTAAGGGTVTSNGGTTLTAEGVCFGLTLNPALGGTCTSDGTVSGAYVSSLTGLTPGQLYHVRAYATNSVGTSYGTDTTFTTLAAPTVTTTVISSITSTTATGGGNATSNGGTTLTAEGVCFGLTLNPALGGTCTSDGTVSGAYVSSLTGLTPGQLYHVRAYATNSVGTSYGTDTTFTTLAAPTVTTTVISSITSTTATGGGTVTSNGGTTLTAEGVCYGLTLNPALGSTCTSDGTVSGAYVSSLTGLTPGQLYHVRAYATNSVGTSYGTDTTFTTLALPTVTTTTITGITSTTATGGGNVTSNGGTTLTAEGVCFGLTLNPAIGGTCTSDGTVTGAYVSSLTGLTPGQLYHVRAYATNSVGTSYGTDLTFTTLAVQYTLTVTTTGTGSGTVMPTSGTITWSGNTGTGTYDSDASVTLTASATDNCSIFTSWSGACSGNANPCIVVMSDNESETATFSATLPVKIGSSYFPTIQSAFACQSLSAGDVVQIQAMTLTEDSLIWNQSIDVTLVGGYGCDFSINPGFTTIYGTLTISNGSLTIEDLILQ